MKFPPKLNEGDKVSIISPAGKIERRILEHASEMLTQIGFKVEIGNHAFDQEGIYAGSDSDRAADMQKVLDDKTIKAIFFARGGYGSIRTHQLLNWSSFFKKPKWLIGFSDITVFHAYLSLHNVASMHGVMTAWFEKEGALTQSFLMMLSALKGEKQNYALQPHELNRLGSSTGILTGGNLSIIQSLRGTPLDVSPKGKILFIEDIDEHHYHLDRMILNLKTGGVLEQLQGMIVGYFTGIKDGETPYGKSAYQIIKEAVAPYHFPVAFGMPSGHELPNYPMVLGSRISLEVLNEKVVIKTL
jgi:muramoyltetrapeptide carboxypeptidase